MKAHQRAPREHLEDAAAARCGPSLLRIVVDVDEIPSRRPLRVKVTVTIEENTGTGAWACEQ